MFSFWILASCVVLWICKSVFDNAKLASKARQLGCKPVRNLPSWDPFFSIDLFIQDLRDRGAHQHLKASISRYEQLGTHTFRVKILGQEEFRTKDPENLKHSLLDKEGLFGVGPMREQGMTPFCGQGFLTADGDVWRDLRLGIKPSFAKNRIKDLTVIDKYASLLTELLPVEETVDFQEWILRMYVDASQEFILGRAPGAFSASDDSGAPLDTKTYLDAFSKSLVAMGMLMMIGPFRFFVPAKMTTEPWNKVYLYIDYFIDRALKEKTETKEEEEEEEEQEDSLAPKSVLQIVSKQSKDRLQIRNQVLHGLMAAQDTIATLIANTIFCLARHPDIWTRLRVDMLKHDPSSIRADALLQEPLLKNILSEVLRLHPLFPQMTRVALQPTTLPRGGGPDSSAPILIPAGARISFDFIAAHVDPTVYGANVNAFDPDRWNAIAPSTWEYLPFGGGRRQCLGREKALIEASYVLWKLVRTYERVEARDEGGYEPVSRLVTQNAKGCKVAFFRAEK